MTGFGDRLAGAIEEAGTCACVGLDPRYELLPKTMRAAAERRYGDGLRARAAASGEFARAVTDIVADHVGVVKPQVAFFEMHGAQGMREYARTLRHARKRGLIAIGDAKRADIGSTAAAYAAAHLTAGAPFECDALTANPYFGTEGIAPFIEAGAPSGKGVFVLVRTSNPSSDEVQGGARGSTAKRVAKLVREWGAAAVGGSGYSPVAAVVGATWPEEAAALRRAMPATFILAPGYGAQGGTLDGILPLRGPDGGGVVVNSSRGVIFAYGREPYARRFGERRWERAVEAACLDMREDLAPLMPGSA